MNKNKTIILLIILLVFFFIIVAQWPILYGNLPFNKYLLDVNFKSISELYYSIDEFEENYSNINNFFTNLSKQEQELIRNNKENYIITQLSMIVINNNEFDVTYVKFKNIDNIIYNDANLVFWEQQNWLINDSFPIETSLSNGEYYCDNLWIILDKEDYYKIKENFDNVNIEAKAIGTKWFQSNAET